MRNIVRIIGVSLAAMAGSLMVAGVAWAQAEETRGMGTGGGDADHGCNPWL
jgi:hypothetical protein